MKIEGKVATIIFKNDTNFWTVMLLKVDKEYITAVGETHELEVGDEIELEGIETAHKVYGTQFKFTTYKKKMPRTKAALIQYIADNVKGIGKKTANSIVEKFGDETVDVIRYDSNKLDGIKGLNMEKIDAISNFFNEQWEKWNVVDYLSQFGISVIVANKIYQNLGIDTITVVKENPYSLIGFVKTLEFGLVDEIGQKLGISLNNETRIDTGIIYALNKITLFGHTCTDKKNLITYSKELLQVGSEEVESSIIRLKKEGKLYSQTIDEIEYIFRRSYYLAEDNIAQNIIIHTMQKQGKKSYDKEIEKASEQNSLVLSKEQEEAIRNCLNNSISIITGGPGTGKTTIIKCIIEILEMLKKEYVLCAPTGRAAKRMTQTTDREAKTVHRLLEITKVSDDDLDMFYETQVKAIESDVVILDEASMMDCLMMNNLFKAIKATTQIIMVGDVDQLPSVGPGSVLKDIIDSDTVNVVYLKQIYRQSSKSDIIVNAHKVNSGDYPEFKTKETDLFFVKTDSIEDTIAQISSLISHRLEKFAKFDILKDLQLLTPMKKTELGTMHINNVIQEILNPKLDSKNEKEVLGNKVFREGDKVMQIINNYDKKFSINGESFEGIYNGDIGYIEKIDNVNQKMHILFDEEKLIIYEFEELDQLELAYAVTIHKSQGSEFDYIILPIYNGYPKLFTRNLLYTAMTRAKKMLIIVGNKKIINYMVDNNDSKNRKTGLKHKIIGKL
jgi:exodeoxyribonuclease V alpha subunit